MQNNINTAIAYGIIQIQLSHINEILQTYKTM